MILSNQQNEFQKFVNLIKLDESSFRASSIRDFRSKLKRRRETIKQPDFGTFEGNGRVCMESMPNCKKRLKR